MTAGLNSGSDPGPGRLDDPYVRFNARLLDPTVAGRLPDGSAAAATSYVSHRLLVTADNQAAAIALLGAIDSALEGTTLTRTSADPFERVGNDNPGAADHNDLVELLELAVAAGVPVAFPVTVGSITEKDDAPAPEDVWPVLRRLRQRGTDRSDEGEIGLDHLMFGAASIYGDGVHPIATALVGGDGVHPIATSFGASSYEQQGFGGHGPVAVVISPPVPTGRCSPHVVVLDTGVGVHPWFAPPSATVNTSLSLSSGRLVGVDVTDTQAIATDPEGAGAIPDRMTGQLGSHAGHGTFIAGLLRQKCPDADLTVLRIMDVDGVVPEWDLSKALIGLGVKVAEEKGSIDALVLSLGYYAEVGDRPYVAGQKRQLLALARRGVVTFAAAGNDCTELPSYPAAFAAQPEFNPDQDSFEKLPTLPLVAVAALNPDKKTVALFSNDGTWVNGEAVGANLVSTAPQLAQGSYQAVVSVIGPGGRRRSTLDPDDFSGGFATWSGTSFAAPVLAGKYLSRLVEKICKADVSVRLSLVPLRKK